MFVEGRLCRRQPGFISIAGYAQGNSYFKPEIRFFYLHFARQSRIRRKMNYNFEILITFSVIAAMYTILIFDSSPADHRGHGRSPGGQLCPDM